MTKTKGERPLTKTQLEVLRMIAAGYESPEIAEELHISEFTARTHVANLRDRLGADTRAQAVAIGYEKGYLP